MVIDINNLPNTPGSSNKTSKPAINDTQTQNKGPQATPASEEVKSTTVNISDNARAVSDISDKIKELPDVDMDRVKALKSAINNGEYEVNAAGIASKMIEADQL